ncbi:AraC family transcriptional regulator [Vallitalea guaymasensis]|uniref:Helix-turn-helix transcriptional regulator n=2 Tax=Vallitalea guaymasensis TaxID=1185412 RepID=A0A8J8SBG1_9FIRM|nr:AraC family transcriptional regulator [Vallitalea guaymasensis]QUH28748.1 helix-turn-helix transcriptional regulator [Vallitalea guaymasensis]
MKAIDNNNLENIVPNIRTVIDRTGFEGWSVPTRTIQDHELVLILEGKGSFSVEGIEYPVRPGMLFYFYPDLVHSGRTCLDPPMHFLAVHFSFALTNYNDGNWTMDTESYRLPLEPVSQLQHSLKAQQALESLYKTFIEKRESYKWKLKILFQEFVYEALYDLNNPPKNYANISRVEKALNYINEHYTESISISQLCSMIKLSRGHFTKMFKSITNKTPVEYINQVRIEHSKDLLVTTSLHVKTIAVQTGFNDEFYFTRVFKQYEGCSPSQYRQGLLK